jgi:hypothetical protein
MPFLAIQLDDIWVIAIFLVIGNKAIISLCFDCIFCLSA